MKIYIDNDPLDFKLENEKNIHDVLASLEKWLAGFERLPIEINLDGKQISEKNMLTTHATPVEQVQELHINTASITEVKGENCLEILSYLGKFFSRMEQGDRETVTKEALEGLIWVNKSVRLLSALNGINLRAFPEADDSLHDNLDLITVQIDSLVRIPDLEKRYNEFIAHTAPLLEKMGIQVEQFVSYIARRMKSEIDLEERLVILSESFTSLSRRVAGVASDLQTGQEERAMLTIQETAVMIEDLLSVLNKVSLSGDVQLKDVVINEQPLDGWMNRLQEIGYEIIEAFKNEDSVLLGDLFEYELSEQLEQAVKYITAVREKINTD